MGMEISPHKSVDSRVRNILAEKLGFSESEIANNASFSNDLDVDSLDLYEVFMELEKEFRIQIPDEDAEKLHTVGSVISYIKNKGMN
jgi:acyl carrier protein